MSELVQGSSHGSGRPRRSGFLPGDLYRPELRDLPLTEKQREVFERWCQGGTLKAIGDAVNISARTVGDRLDEIAILVKGKVKDWRMADVERSQLLRALELAQGSTSAAMFEGLPRSSPP